MIKELRFLFSIKWFRYMSVFFFLGEYFILFDERWYIGYMCILLEILIALHYVFDYGVTKDG
jgi:hypothetical protein